MINNVATIASVAGILTIVFFVLAVICFILAVLFFFAFKIPNVIGDLTGHNAKKTINRMREDNEKVKNKSHRPHPVAVERGTITQPIDEKASEVKRRKRKATEDSSPTEKIDSKQLIQNAKVNENVFNSVSNISTASSATHAERTSQSTQNATVRLEYDANGTEVLTGATTVLTSEQTQAALNTTVAKFNMIQDIILIHTQEVI